MPAKLFSSQNKSSSGECDSLTPCIRHLSLCNMQKILYDYSSAKKMGIFYRYIIIIEIVLLISNDMTGLVIV